MICPDLLRNQMLGEFKAAIGREHEGVVAAAVRVEGGEVIEYVVCPKMSFDDWRRLMEQPPKEKVRS